MLSSSTSSFEFTAPDRLPSDVFLHVSVVLVNGEDVEFADVCRHYLGEKAYYVAIVFAVLTFSGASIVYWVNFGPCD